MCLHYNFENGLFHCPLVPLFYINVALIIYCHTIPFEEIIIVKICTERREVMLMRCYKGRYIETECGVFSLHRGDLQDQVHLPHRQSSLLLLLSPSLATPPPHPASQTSNKPLSSREKTLRHPEPRPLTTACCQRYQQ